MPDKPKPAAPVEATEVAVAATAPKLKKAAKKPATKPKEAPVPEEQASEAQSQAPVEPVQEATPVDPTPEEEAAPQVADYPNKVDGQGILTQTNQDVIDNFPKNENGQVVIENGRIVGLPDDKQPLPSAFE